MQRNDFEYLKKPVSDNLKTTIITNGPERYQNKSSPKQGCELELELEELGNFGRTRTRKIKISELELELELEKSL